MEATLKNQAPACSKSSTPAAAGQDTAYIKRFNRSIRQLFGDALRLSLREPGLALFMAQTTLRQNQAARRRLAWERRGVHVPPFMIASITRRCNLRCKGCYAMAQERPAEPELSTAQLSDIIEQANDLGISITLIAGGEPLTRPDILEIIAAHPEIIFPLFTNGMLLDDPTIDRMRRMRNLVPVVSLEGHQNNTDDRRGAGVHSRGMDNLRRMQAAGLFFGVSFTLTSYNCETVLDRAFLQELAGMGCRVFFFVDFVPAQEGTEALVLSDEQRAHSQALLEQYSRELPALFIALPGDEEQYGGCLAAGRGFVHVSPEGRLEPCPFSPFSDVSLKTTPLREALGSRLLRSIRDNADKLSETRGGCALWKEREWVSSLVPAPVEARIEP